MFTTLKMFIGFLFSLGMAGFAIYKRKTYGTKPAIMTAIVAVLAAIIFLGKFVSRLGG
jgi:hypothetical protein